MTIHDPDAEVSCDYDEICNQSIFIPLPWSVGGYSLDEEEIEKKLKDEHDWLTVGDKHYCHHCKRKLK